MADWFVFSASAEELPLEAPGGWAFVKDHADLLDKVSKFTVRSMGGALLRDQTIPIIVVTIESMRKYSDEGMRIEAFAGLLFDQWQIGHINQGEQSWNKGILLLVSKNDRKARIELGAGWGYLLETCTNCCFDGRLPECVIFPVQLFSISSYGFHPIFSMVSQCADRRVDGLLCSERASIQL